MNGSTASAAPSVAASENVMILASAGTGKTFELSSRYIHLLLEGAHPRSILATTFTRKAAGEILDRIVLRLAAAAGDAKTATATSAELKLPPIPCERFGEVLLELVRNLNNLQVETLDAFFFRIARAFSLDMGMPPAWQIADDSEVVALSNRAIRQSLTDRAVVSIVHDLAKGEAKHRVFPFLEREGEYWGPPADDTQAIHELERLRLRRASFIVFAWPAFWWMEHYKGFAEYLQSHFTSVLNNESLIVFDIRRSALLETDNSTSFCAPDSV